MNTVRVLQEGQELRRRNFRSLEGEIRSLRKENRRLNAFRNGVLWISAFVSAILAIVLMARATRIEGHMWEIIPAFLLIGYLMFFIYVNGEEDMPCGDR